MARRPVVDREELFEAATRLEAEGKPVTALALLDALGGGSLTTIYKHLGEWESGRQTATSVSGNNEMPAAVSNAFSSAWRIAAQESAKEVQAAREEAAKEVQAAQQQFAGALQAIEQLEKDSEADAQQIESLNEKIADLEGALRTAISESAAFKATAEQLGQQVKSQGAELERMHSNLDRDRLSHQSEIGRLTSAAEAAQDKANAQIEGLQKTIATAQGKAEQLEKERAEALTKLEATVKQLEKSDTASKSDRTERDAAIKEAAELRGQLTSLKTQNSELVAQLGKNKEKRNS